MGGGGGHGGGGGGGGHGGGGGGARRALAILDIALCQNIWISIFNFMEHLTLICIFGYNVP